MQGGVAEGPRRIAIHGHVQQEPHGGQVPPLRCQVERVEPAVAGGGGVHATAHENFHHLCVTVLCGKVDGAGAAAVGKPHVSAPVDQELGGPGGAVPSGEMQGSPAFLA